MESLQDVIQTAKLRLDIDALENPLFVVCRYVEMDKQMMMKSVMILGIKVLGVLICVRLRTIIDVKEVHLTVTQFSVEMGLCMKEKNAMKKQMGVEIVKQQILQLKNFNEFRIYEILIKG